MTREVKDYVVLPRGQHNCLPPLPLILDVVMTHDRHGYGRSTLPPTGKITHTLSSNGTPHPDGVLKNAVRKKNTHYRRLYVDPSDPPVFMSVREHISFIRSLFALFFLASFSCLYIVRLVMCPENSEESDQFHFLP